MAASVHEIIAAEFSRCNAQLVVARECGYVTWKELVAADTLGEDRSRLKETTRMG